MNLRENIKKILKEELSNKARRRVNFGDMDKMVRREMISNFTKNVRIEKSIGDTIKGVAYDIMSQQMLQDFDESELSEIFKKLKDFIREKYIDELRQYFEKRQKEIDEDNNPLGIKYIFIKHNKPYYSGSGWQGFAEGFDSFSDMITKRGNMIDVDWDEIKKKLDNINDYPVQTYTGTMNTRPLKISSIGDKGNDFAYNFSIIKQVPEDNVDMETYKIKGIQTEESDDEIDEYARTLKNARKQGRGLKFPKSAIKSNPSRFRPYNRDMVDESDPKTGTGKKPEGSSRRLYTDENPKDTVSVKFRTKEDIVDTLNKDSFKSKPHKRQSQIINLIHQRVRAAYQNAKDPETKKRLKRGLDYIENEKEKSKEKTIKLQKEEMKEGELTEKCWAGYEKKGMKTMFGKRYPNCVKKTKK